MNEQIVMNTQNTTATDVRTHIESSEACAIDQLQPTSSSQLQDELLEASSACLRQHLIRLSQG